MPVDRNLHSAVTKGVDWKSAFARTLIGRFPAMNPDRADEIADTAAAQGLDRSPVRVARDFEVPGWSSQERADSPRRPGPG